MTTLLIMIVVLTVVALLPIGADGGYSGGKASMRIKIGFISLLLLPKKEKGLKHGKTYLNREQQKVDKKKKRFDKQQVIDIMKISLKALSRLRKKLSLDYLRIHYTFASDDPASTALGFAVTASAVSAFAPLLDSAFRIKERDFAFKTDFLTDKPTLDVWFNISIMFWEIAYVAAAVCIDYLKFVIRHKKLGFTKERNESNGKTSNW